MKKLWMRLFGVPVWIISYDATVYKSKLKVTPDGTYLVRGIVGWLHAKPDGTIASNRHYIKKWVRA